MRKTFTLLLLTLSVNVFSQYLIDQGDVVALTFVKSNKIMVKVHQFDSGRWLPIPGQFEYKMAHDEIFETYYLDSDTQIGESYRTGFIPGAIKVRNNNFRVSISENDSVLLDDKNRKTKLYERKPPGGSSNYGRFYRIHEVTYVSDTIVYHSHAMSDGFSSCLSVYRLNSRKDIIEIKTACGTKELPHPSGIDTVSFYEGTRFGYDRKGRLRSVEAYIMSGGVRETERRQLFYYKKRRVVKSLIYNGKDKIRPVYRYEYSYFKN